MSLAIKYENVQDASMRLKHTVVLYRGEPVLIQEVVAGDGKDDIFRVLFQELPVNGMVAPAKAKRIFDAEEAMFLGDAKPAAAQQRKYISSKHFDIAPFKLGYVNSTNKNGAFYCSRLPNRIQKQGLCHENFVAKDNLGNLVPWQSFVACKEVPAMVAGKYPTFEQAVRALDKVPAVAFDREFCLMRDPVITDLIFLYHKGQKVGMYARGEATLGQKFRCLKESLQELHLKVGAC